MATAEPPVELDRPAAHDVADQFERGNFAAVALAGRDDRWETYASLGLLGLTDRALAGLARFPGDAPRFYEAAAYWISGDDHAATTALASIADRHDHARNLLEMVGRPTIQVLAQMPWTRRAPHDLISGAANDPKFVVRNLSFDPADEPNEPYLDLWDRVDRAAPPDFYVCNMVEWHLVPPNIQELPCPILGHTADYDLHLHAVYPWLQLFDELIVTDHTEWADVQALVDRPVTTFPKCFGLPDRLPDVPRGERPIDFFMSGTLLAPYHPDKAKVLHEILSTPDLETRYIRGFLANDAYQAFLGAAKASFSFVRHPGALPTRGVETLSMGSALVLQEDSILNLYVGEEQGAVSYGPDPGSLRQAIRRIVEDGPGFAERASAGAAVVREHFAMSRVASQYLRYLTFVAARPRDPRELRTPPPQKRTVLSTGWQPESPTARRQIMQANVAEYGRRLNHSMAPSELNDMAREFVLEFAYYEKFQREATREPAFYERACELYALGTKAFPSSLVLQFNSIRTRLHFGSPAEQEAALGQALDVLAADPDSWELGPEDDVLPYDCFADAFNYRTYMDLATDWLAKRTADRPALIRLIRASLSFYVGKAQSSRPLLAEACRLDPDFSYYRLPLARILMAAGEGGSDERARDLLVELAEGSPLFPEAVAELERLTARSGLPCPRLPELRRPCTKLVESQLTIRPAITVRVERVQTARRGEQEPADAAAPAPTIPRPDAGRPLVSAVIPAWDRAQDLSRLIDNLLGQTIAKDVELLIGQTAKNPLPHRVVQRVPNLRVVDLPAGLGFADALNRCVQLARGRYATICAPGDVRQLDTLEILVSELESTSGAQVAYADNTYYADPVSATHADIAEGTVHWQDHDPGQLFQSSTVGPHAVWNLELHSRHGWFDPEMGPGAEYQFWLRICPTESIVHVDDCLSNFWIWTEWSGICRDPELDPTTRALTEKARVKHWPTVWGPRPESRSWHRLCYPANVLQPTVELEARSQLDLRILREGDLAAVHGFAALHQSAIRHADHIAARLAAESLVARVPTLTGARHLLANLLVHTSGPAAATAVLRDAVAVDATAVTSLLRLAVNLTACGDAEGAERALATAAERDPRNPDLPTSLGSLALQRGDLTVALQHYESAIRIDDRTLDAQIGIAVVTLSTGDMERFRQARNRARVLAPQHPRVLALDQLT